MQTGSREVAEMLQREILPTTLYTLHSAPYTLHSAPYTLHSASCTVHVPMYSCMATFGGLSE